MTPTEECQHLNTLLYRCVVGEFEFWKCTHCKANFKIEARSGDPGVYVERGLCKHNILWRSAVSMEFWRCIVCEKVFALTPAEIKVTYP